MQLVKAATSNNITMGQTPVLPWRGVRGGTWPCETLQGQVGSRCTREIGILTSLCDIVGVRERERVRVCVRERERDCECVCVCVSMWACVCLFFCFCLAIHPPDEPLAGIVHRRLRHLHVTRQEQQPSRCHWKVCTATHVHLHTHECTHTLALIQTFTHNTCTHTHTHTLTLTHTHTHTRTHTHTHTTHTHSLSLSSANLLPPGCPGHPQPPASPTRLLRVGARR